MDILLSTGTFIGRVNNRNHDLLTEFGGEFDCDGFEVMIFASFYEKADYVTDKYRRSGLRIPVMHFDKEIGNGIGSPDPEKYRHALSLLRANLVAAEKLGAKKAVIHLWGRDDSDRYPDLIYRRTGEITELCSEYGVLPVYENIFCCVSSPLRHMEKLAEMYPDIRFTIDSRPAQFHAELEETLKSPVMKNAAHLHINDYAGGYREWEKVNPIPQPGKGNIDWDMYFAGIRRTGYDGTVTLEAPAHLPVGVDSAVLNKSLRFLRDNLCSER